MRPLRSAPAPLLLLLLLLAAPARAEHVRLSVLHTTDLHGALTAYDYAYDRPAARGLTKIATLVKAVRADSATGVLLLDAGDAIQGGGIETIYRRGEPSKPDPMIGAMNRMGYDALAVGNHEFSFGPEALARARKESSFPWLAANVRRDDGSQAFAPSLVKVVRGVRVGIVGLTTPAVPALEDSARWAGFRFGSPVDAAIREISSLRTHEQCDVVVVLAHTGMGSDSAAANGPDENWGKRLADIGDVGFTSHAGMPVGSSAIPIRGADLIILGHTHEVIPYTVGTLVTQAGKWGEALGRVDIELDRTKPGAPWTITSRRANIIAVTDSTPEDSALAAYAEPWHRATQTALDQPIGKASQPVDAPRGRLADGPLWELIQRAQLAAGNADVSLAALPDPAAAIAPGTVTLRECLRAYPFDNTLAVVEMTGADLKAALERSVARFNTYTFESDRPMFAPDPPAWDLDAAQGVSYEVDLTRAPGDRILQLTFKGAPLASDRKLKVAVNSYRLAGGGGYATVARAPRLWRSRKSVRDLIADYIRSAGTLDGSASRNWRILPDYAATPERPLIDLLVRQGVAPRPEVLRLEADSPAQRGDAAYWLARAFGWRETKLSGAFADVPDSLEPWLDGLLKRKVLGPAASADNIKPFEAASVAVTLEWCERAARDSKYVLVPGDRDANFRRGLLAGVSVPASKTSLIDTLTRAQLLGIVANTRFPTLRILETTDFHGAILGGSRERRTNRALGGSAVLAAWIARLRAENPEGTVLIDGGDLFQGTMISNLQFGRPVVEQMNALGYVASAIGNHEFDWTADTLAHRIREMRFAALGANVSLRASGKRPWWARNDTVVVRRGVRVGVLGLCYVGTPSVTLPANVAHLKFADDSTTAAQLAPVMRRDQHAQIVVGVGHIPAETDSSRRARSGDLPRLAGVAGVDAWFGGHSHNLVLDERNGVPIMIAGSHGEAVGVCDLVFDPVRGRVVEKHTRLVTTYADQVTPDSAMAARATRWNADVAPIAATPIGRNARALTRGGVESSIGDFVADAMRLKAGADVALQNSGGLRADLADGEVTKGMIYEVMPFDNTIYLLELTGTELRRALEEALAHGRVSQVSGIRYAFDGSLPEFQRITSLTRADGAPLDTARTLLVACNNFMATGGDNSETLSKGRNRRDTGLTVRAALEEFVIARSKNGQALEVAPDGRIKRLGGRTDGTAGR